MRKFLIAAIVFLIAFIMVLSGLAYYRSDHALKQREKERIRDECYAAAKERYNAYLSQNSRLNPDGSVGLSPREKEHIERIKKEEYRVCTELFSIK